VTVSAQDHDPDSMLAFYREALAARPRSLDTRSPLAWNRRDSVLDLGVPGAPGIRVVLNLGTAPVPLPDGDVLLTSDPLSGGMLPPDTAAWLPA
jgi:alpha-glucosidase